MTKFEIKLYLTLFFAVVIAAMFFYVNEASENLLKSHADILHRLNDLELHDEKINEEALSSAFRLYETYDTINRNLQQIREDTTSIANNPLFADEIYRPFKDDLNLFLRALDDKEEAVNKFATLNSLIKNSATHIPSMASRYLQRFGFKDQEYLQEISRITFTVFQARNAMDADLLTGIDESIKDLQSRKFDDPEMARFNQVFLAHARVMQRYLPIYLPIFDQIINNPMSDLLHRVQNSFVQISSDEAVSLRRVSSVLSVVFIASVLFIIYLFFDLEKAHRYQHELTQTLEKRATTDRLTSLSNRFAFEQEDEEFLQQCALMLINVDGFKNINDFFGREVGDEFLKFLAGVVSQFREINVVHKIYRVGADEFGVLVKTTDRERLIGLASSFISEIESSRFKFQDINLDVQISIGVSMDLPLLEKADIALRKIKNTRSKYMLYEGDEYLEKQVKANLSMMHFIREAIEKDYIEPHFMPIMNNADLSIQAYECLIRLRDKNGKLFYPDEFLNIAKEGRLYGQLTHKMFDKCLQKFALNDFHFSINLSIEDIEDQEISDYIVASVGKSSDLAGRLTLEILESEGVKNYSVLQTFIERVKFYGCKIAIDDYGTGYSNLQHLVNLKVDNLKLDGSLIEPLVSDASSYVAVKAIVEMANDLGIPTTSAEFVSSKEIYAVVKSLGISQSQGYYIGQAKQDLTATPDFLL
jgi:diguanylate cyclase (GGDEF)-like protein